MMRRIVLGLVLLCCAAGCSSLGDVGGGLVGLPVGLPVANKDAVAAVEATTVPVHADGLLVDAAWKRAVSVGDFSVGRGNRPEVETRVLVTYDANNLYVAVVCNEPGTDKLKATVATRDGNVWEDDSVEIYIDPSNKREGRRGEYYGFFVNSKNVVYDRSTSNDWSGEWTSGAAVIPGVAWVAEVAVPWKTMGIAPKAGHKFGLMVARNRFAGLPRMQGHYLAPCDDEAKDTSKYIVFELK